MVVFSSWKFCLGFVTLKSLFPPGPFPFFLFEAFLGFLVALGCLLLFGRNTVGLFSGLWALVTRLCQASAGWGGPAACILGAKWGPGFRCEPYFDHCPRWTWGSPVGEPLPGGGAAHLAGQGVELPLVLLFRRIWNQTFCLSGLVTPLPDAPNITISDPLRCRLAFPAACLILLSPSSLVLFPFTT